MSGIRERWVEWMEPAYDKDGIVITQIVRMKVDDAIDLWKRTHPEYPYTNDSDIVMDFITVHWAVVKEY